MKKYTLIYLPVFFLLIGSIAFTDAQAQFNTPTINGTITAGEYGTHTNGQNQETNGAIWYMTWDDNNLYIALSNIANSTNGNNRKILVYIDKNPITPINGGTNSDGTITGFSYSNSQLGTLPFRADCFFSIETGYRQLNIANGSNGWGGNNTGYGAVSFGSSNDVMEISIPWSTITGGGSRPASFAWTGYITDGNGGGNYFNQMPAANPSGLQGTSIPVGSNAGFERYYLISSTTNGSSTLPFSRNCFVFNRLVDQTNFGSISVYDFTMNSAGRFLSRSGATTQNWTIGGNLVCGAGTIYFGSGGTNGSYGTTTVTGNLDIRGGTVDMDQTTSSLDVTGDLSLSSGTLKLSANAFGGGDLKLKGNWSNTGGTFTPSTRAVFFNSTTANQSISKSGTETFDYFFVVKSSTVLSLLTSIQVNNTLNLTSGSLSIGSNTLTLNGTVVNTSGTISGSSTSNLTIGGTALAQNLNFTTGARVLKNLTLNSGATATLGTPLDIATGAANTSGIVTVNSGATLTTGGNLTIKSDANGTASIGNSAGTISGDVTVERWIPQRNGIAAGGRAYRLLTPSVTTTGASTIRSNWMENGQVATVGGSSNPVANYGTHITGTGGLGSGFDVTQNNQASLYTTTNGAGPDLPYTAAPNTTDNLDAKKGYFLYIRGDRSSSLSLPYNPGGGMATTSTTLRAKGTVQQGTINFPISSTAGHYSMITNPYASVIDWQAVSTANSNISTSYTMWDPNVGTEGGFVVVTFGGSATPNTSSAGRYIQPGQAFLVQTNSGSSINITEAMKVTGNNNNGVYRTTPFESFGAELYFTEANNNIRHSADGVLVKYGNSYSSNIDQDDYNELNNWNENIAINRSGTQLTIEARPVIISRDTIPLLIGGLRQTGYEWVFTPSMFTNIGLKAELIDNFLNTRTLLSVIDSVVVPFTVTSNPASSAANRFMVVFGPFSPLAIDVITIKAQAKNNGVQVDWTAKTEQDMDRYELERSFNGTSFSNIKTTAAVGNSPVAVNYGWLDASPQAGANFYRIKAIDKAGLVKYTSIVKVDFGKTDVAITVSPNPVKGNSINLKLADLPKGSYTLQLFNSKGQLVFASNFNHSGGAVNRPLNLVSGIAAGTYQLVLNGGDTRLQTTIIKN